MKPSLGRIVSYVLSSADGVNSNKVGQVRPAIIVNTWGNEVADASEGGSAVQLQVFIDGANDHPTEKGSLWATSVYYSEQGTDPNDPTALKERSWHWPARV